MISLFVDPLQNPLLYIFLVVAAIYTRITYNDLTCRRERLKGLLATIRSMRARRHGVGSDVSRGVRWATGHERAVARLGTRRGGRGRRLISDVANGWAPTTAVASANQGMTLSVDSHNKENQAWLDLQREAEIYNARVRQFPSCLVAQAFGFQTWRFAQPSTSGRRFRSWRR
ncbi:MAG: hypothetical protein HRU71_12995 [Planctomycetia bacterium]|nr:MAG: hypothetical protein HRU71_12995 [Planctomycetia bacterium]